jgi:hypothetical protein
MAGMRILPYLAIALAWIASAGRVAGQTPALARAVGALAGAGGIEISRSSGWGSAPNSFLIEAVGGSVGSLVGIGLVGLVSHCDVEDLGCIITSVGAGGLVGAICATAGATIAARQTGSNRSVAGAAIGSIVGTGVGLGVHYLLNSGSDRNLGDAIVIPIFVVSQGTLAALGSRLMGSNQ